MTLPIKMRSWLFAPGDSEKKMAKAADSAADIALFDLEDAVATENKAIARQMVHDFLAARSKGRERLWVRLFPPGGTCPQNPARSCCAAGST